ncbi:AEC family transporter [Marinobacter nanhaiticus D15-8W]|uniref:AEC family transporter n=1 Tax=Marinobacter nanhaiticus D15-8W TaxID=626887 RepID=N6WWH8_9GAMM|nr:AEC family transporter [Marinobacter nanhaiticus]ENO15412.1 AEC family transporter [Marinobacter nanhaiticus D15-8W]BES73739.1 AEC family transporter [Marinobacter nanhaiticus D15-8W]
MSYLDNLLFSLSVTAPIFLVMAAGWLLRRVHWIDDTFVETGSRLVYRLALPALILTSLVDLDLSTWVDPKHVGFGMAATMVSFILLWIVSAWWPGSGPDRGVFVQGAFRGNLGIIGIAVCASLYGKTGLAVGSVLLAGMTLLYNVLSVFALTAASGRGGASWRNITSHLLHNPLIVSILLGLLLAAFKVPVPDLILTSAAYFGQMTLPLALLCVGATLSLSALRLGSSSAIVATVIKLVLLPLFFTLSAIPLGFDALQLGTLFAMFASPTATVSYVMARSMGGNHQLAANIIALTTLFAPVSLSLGIYLLRTLELI